MKRLRTRDGSERRIPRRPEMRREAEDPGSDGVSLRFVGGRGVVSLGEEPVFPAVVLDQLEMMIPQIAFPFDVSRGVRGLRNKRLTLSHLKLSVGIDPLKELLRSRISAVSGFSDLNVAFEADAISILLDCGPPDAIVRFSFRLLPVLREQIPVLVPDDIRPFGPVPAPLLRLTAVALAELTGWGLDGISLVPPDPVRSVLLRVLPPRGWRLPDSSDVRLKGFSLLPDRLELEFVSPQMTTDEKNTGIMRFSSARLRRMEELRGTLEADTLLAAGELEVAREAYARLLDRTPDNPSVATRIAMLDILNPDLRESSRQYLLENRHSIEEREDFQAVLVHAAAIGDDAAAEIDILEMWMKSGLPLEQVGAALRLGELLRRTDPTRAIGHLEKAMAVRRNDPRLLQMLLDLLIICGENARVPVLVTAWIALYRDPAIMGGVYTQAGQFLLDVDEYSGALRYFERALIADPENADASWGMAAALSGQGDVQRAIAAYEGLIVRCRERKDSDGSSRALHAIGDIWFRNGQPDLAVTRLRDALQLRWDPDTQGLLAASLTALGQVEEGLREYEESLRRDRRRDSSFGHRALTLARLYCAHREDYQSAERWIDEASRCSGMDEAVSRLHIEVLEKQQKWKELASKLERDAGRNEGTGPESVDRIVRLASVRLAAGEARSALSTLESVVARFPEREDIVDAYIEAVRAVGDVRKLEDALKRRHPSMSGSAARSRMATEIGALRLSEYEDPRGALDWFRRALTDQPDSVVAREGVVTALERLGDHDVLSEEITALIEGYQMEGQRVEAALSIARLARIRIEQGERKIGADLLREALPDLPAQARQDAMLNMALLYHETGDAVLARDMYVRIRQTGGPGDRYRAALGEAECALQLKDHEAAFEAAVVAGSGPAELRVRAVQLLAKAAVPLGRSGDAVDVLRRVAQNVPEPEAETLLFLAAETAASALSDPSVALSCYEDLLEMNPCNERARNRMIALLEESGDRTSLARGIVRFAGSGSEDVKDLQRAADFFSAEGHLEDAAEALWKAYEMQPDAESARMLGIALRRSGQMERMVSLLKPFAASDESIRDMLVAYWRETDNTDAIVSLLSASRGTTVSRERQRLLALSDIVFGKGTDLEGAGYLLSAAELKPEDPESGHLYHRVARIALEHRHPGLLSRCMDGLSSVLGPPEMADLELSLALLSFTERSTEAAEAALERSLAYDGLNLDTLLSASRRHPGFESLLRKTGHLATEQGRWSDAEEIIGLQLSRASEPDKASLLRRRATLRELRLNDREGAAADFWTLFQSGLLLEEDVDELERLLTEQDRIVDLLAVLRSRFEYTKDWAIARHAADVAFRLGDTNAEIALLREVTERTEDIESQYRLVMLLTRPEDRAEQLALIEKIGERAATLSPIAQKDLLELAVQNQEGPAQAAIWKRLMELVPSDSGYVDRLRALLTENDQFEELAEVLQRRLTLTLSPSVAAATWNELGKIRREYLDDMEGALTAFQKASGHLGGDRETWMNVAEILFLQEQYEELRDCLVHLADVEWHPDVALWRARVLEHSGNLEDALTVYREMVDRAPQVTSGHEGFLRLVPEGTEIDSVLLAREHLFSASSKVSLSAQIHRKIGVAYWRLKDGPSARVHLEQACELNEKDSSTLALLAEVLCSLKEYATAATTLERRAYLCDGDERTDALVAAARVLYESLQDYRRAQQLFEEASRLAPREPDVLLGLSDCGWKNQDYHAVTANLERLRVVAPHFAVDGLRLLQFARSLEKTGEWPAADIVELLERIVESLAGTEREEALTLLERLRSVMRKW